MASKVRGLDLVNHPIAASNLTRILMGKMVKPMRVQAKFLKSAADPVHFPAATLPEVAFAGRSNVGKSSLINALLGTKMAHVSSTPGRTQTINFFDVQQTIGVTKFDVRFADLPGYGYAKVSRSLSSEWPKFIEPYLREREAMRLCISLIDSNVPPQESDGQLIAWLQHHQRPYLLVGTKADKLSSNKLRNSITALERAHASEILPVSATTRAGLDELWRRIRDASA
jgi:GTP-binding protein